MSFEINLFLITACLCLIIALIEAWIMMFILVFETKALKRIFKNYRDLVRSHIDYLMMSMLFFALYAVFRFIELEVPAFIAWSSLVGGLLNPFGFLVTAIKPRDPSSGSSYEKLSAVLLVVPLSIGMFWVGFSLLAYALSFV